MSLYWNISVPGTSTSRNKIIRFSYCTTNAPIDSISNLVEFFNEHNLESNELTKSPKYTTVFSGGTEHYGTCSKWLQYQLNTLTAAQTKILTEQEESFAEHERH